jgi:Zn-dependent protease with chaperone function
MRLIVLLFLSAGLASLPYVAGRRLLRSSGPRPAIAVALLSLVGLALGYLFLLVAVIDPADLPTRSIPGVIERCADAARRVFSHPLQHWPRIAATVVLLAFLARLVFATVTTCRLFSRGRPPRNLLRNGGIVGQEKLPEQQGVSVVDVIEQQRPVAYTAGLIRRRVVVSTGLLNRMDASEVRAVLEHERAHVRGWHTTLLFVGKTIVTAFGFLPPVRRAASDLILGLEVAADEAASARVGNPLVVARALVSFAELASNDSRPGVLGIDESELVFRVRRLAEGCHSSRSFAPAAWGLLASATTASLLVGQLLVLPASARTLSAAAESREMHAVCHVPHGQGGDDSADTTS